MTSCILTLLVQKSLITVPDKSTVLPQFLKLKLNFSETCKGKKKRVLKDKKIKSILLVISNFEHQTRSAYLIIIRRPMLSFSCPRNRIGMNIEVNSGDYHTSMFLSFNTTSWVSYHFSPLKSGEIWRNRIFSIIHLVDKRDLKIWKEKIRKKFYMYVLAALHPFLPWWFPSLKDRTKTGYIRFFIKSYII